MPNSTGQNLVDDARSRSGYQNSNFVTDTEVLGWVNDSCKELYDLINAQEESVYTTPCAFALPDPVLAAAYTAASLGTPPANFAALPDTCDRIQGLDFNAPTGGGVGAEGQFAVHMFSFQNRNDHRWMKYKAVGRIAGKEIIMVIPFERAPGNYQLWYIPQFVPLGLADTLDNNMQKFEDFIAESAAIRILDKAKRDASALRAHRAELVARIQTMSQNRDSEAEQGGTATDGHYTQGWPYTPNWGRY